MLAAVTEQYLAGERVDLTIVARELGLGRATIYRWFGSREQLLGLVIADQLERLIDRHRRRIRRRGVAGLLAVFDAINRSLSSAAALQRLLEQERGPAMRLLTRSDGAVQARAVGCVRGLIEAEVDAGRYAPPADPETLAYAIVRLAEAFLYNDAAFGIRGEHARLREVQAALLGAPLAATGEGAAGERAAGERAAGERAAGEAAGEEPPLRSRAARARSDAPRPAGRRGRAGRPESR